MDQKWAECFSRLEAFLLSKSLEKPSPEPTFQTVKMPVRTPPASTVRVSKPFLAPQPADRPVDRPATSTDHLSAEVQGDRPGTTELQQPTGQVVTDQTSAVQHHPPGTCCLQNTQTSDMDTDLDSDPVHRSASGFEEEGDLSHPELDLTATDTDQALSEEQTNARHIAKLYLG